MSNAQGKRRRSTEGAQGTNKGHENSEGMALVGVRLTAQLGAHFCSACKCTRDHCLMALVRAWGYLFFWLLVTGSRDFLTFSVVGGGDGF